MEWYLYVLVIVAGFVAGFINTLAGSGSLITLPLLIFLGLPANVANGTNRVGVFFQNLTALASFQQKGMIDWKRGTRLAIPAVFGAVLGAQIAVNLNETMMQYTIGGLMVVMLGVIIVKPQRWLTGKPEALQNNITWKQYVIFFFVGIYGGFIQAGVGIFMLAGLVLGVGYDLVKANAVKVLINIIFTVFAMGVFLLNDQIRWDYGLLLAIGNAFGGWIAARVAVDKGADFVRWILIAVVTVSAAKLLGVFDVIGRLFGA